MEAEARRKGVTPSLPKGRGTRKAERGSGMVKRKIVELSLSEKPDESGESVSKSSSGHGASKRGQAARRPGLKFSPKRPPRKLDLSPG